jgi:DNA-binding response OmpR family regulator
MAWLRIDNRRSANENGTSFSSVRGLTGSSDRRPARGSHSGLFVPAILVIEDQANLLNSLARGLREDGYVVHAAENGAVGARLAQAHEIDAVILDLMLPGEDGLTLLRRLRASGFTKPVLIVTARDAIPDRIAGLDSGADDYLVKPFSFGELLARLRALLRRSGAATDSVLRHSDIEVELLSRRARRAGQELKLTQRQFELLSCLLRHAGEVVSRDTIAREVWKESTATWTNVIEVQINHLRQKIESAELRPILHTIRGEGYRLGDAP